MAIIDWDVKELLSSDKLNKMTVRRGTSADQQSVPEHERSIGDPWFNTERGAFQVYLRGSGNVFEVSEISNLLFRQEAKIGGDSTIRTIFDKPVINSVGKTTSAIFASFIYKKLSNLRGRVNIRISFGSQIVTKNITTVLDSSTRTFTVNEVLSTKTFPTNAILDIKIQIQNVEISNIEIRGA